MSKEHEVELLGWDRTKKQNELIEERLVNIGGIQVKYNLFCIVAPQGGGLKKIAIPMLKFWMCVRKYLIKHRTEYDAVHFCDFDTAAIAFETAVKLKKKVVYDIFDYYADSHSAPKVIKHFIRLRENFIIEHSDTVIICSEKRKEQIAPAVPRKLVVIHNSPSLEMSFTPMAIKGDLEHRRKRLVYVGMLSEDRYLKEMAECVCKNTEIEWHVAGFGALEHFFIDLEKSNKNIFFYGKIKYSEALFLELQCDIMTAIYNPNIPNHKYASPNKFYEALALGKPVIMVENTGMDQLVSKYQIGTVVRVTNCKEFGKEFQISLNKLVQQSDLKEITRQSKKLYEEQFSWNNMEERLLEIYKCLE